MTTADFNWQDGDPCRWTNFDRASKVLLTKVYFYDTLPESPPIAERSLFGNLVFVDLDAGWPAWTGSRLTSPGRGRGNWGNWDRRAPSAQVAGWEADRMSEGPEQWDSLSRYCPNTVQNRPTMCQYVPLSFTIP